MQTCSSARKPWVSMPKQWLLTSQAKVGDLSRAFPPHLLITRRHLTQWEAQSLGKNETRRELTPLENIKRNINSDKRNREMSGKLYCLVTVLINLYSKKTQNIFKENSSFFDTDVSYLQELSEKEIFRI